METSIKGRSRMTQQKKSVFSALAKWSCTKWFAYAVLLLFMLIWHFTLGIGFGDDVYFSTPLNDGFTFGRLMDFLSIRYTSWSSRLIIESVLICIVRFPLLWKTLNACILTSIALALDLLLNKRNSLTITWALCAFSFVFPLNMYNSAGWVATTLNYPWPMAAGLLSLLPLKKCLSNERTSWYEYILSILLMLFAANQEQMCILLFAVVLGFSFQIYRTQHSMKSLAFSGLQIVLLTLSLIFILTCPGNSARYNQEILTHFPDYESLSFFDKIEIGFSSTGYTLLMQPAWLMPQNVVFPLFCLLLLITVASLKKHPLVTWIAGIPFFSCLLFNVFHGFFFNVFPHIVQLRDALTEYGTSVRLSSPNTLFPDLILLLVFGCIVVSLWQAFADKKLFVPILLLLLLGLFTRFMMAFSPTVWASGERTSMFLLYILIAISVLLIERIEEIAKGKGHVVPTIFHTSIALFLLYSIEYIF